MNDWVCIELSPRACAYTTATAPLRQLLATRIVLVGGSSLIPGLGAELKKRYDDQSIIESVVMLMAAHIQTASSMY